MIDESIKSSLLEKHGELNFNVLVKYMEDTEIFYYDRKMRGPIGVATPNGIYLDLFRLSNYNDKMIFFIILHEIAHYKRIAKMGVDYMVDMLSDKDFDNFCSRVINEEIIADRYGCLLYQSFNKEVFPRDATQQLHLPNKELKYKNKLVNVFGVVQHNSENWDNLLDFLV